MAALFEQVDRRTKLGIVLLDVMTTERIAFESEVTQYPVEDGTKISDHITEGVKRLSVSGLIALSDGSGAWSFLANDSENQPLKMVDVVESFKKMHKSRELINVSTGQISHDNMAFTRMEVSRSADGGGGNWLSVNVELIEVRKVQLKTADVPPPEQINDPGAKGRGGETNKAAGKSGGSNANKTANNPKVVNDSYAKMLADKTGTTNPIVNGLRSVGGLGPK